jgi:ATP phosphoribosyltransferase
LSTSNGLFYLLQVVLIQNILNPKLKMSILKIAIQKSGRLNEDSIQILKDCGISINNGNDQLKAEGSNFPLEILFLRNSDIPQYLIVGDNLLIEIGKNLKVVEKLGFSKCKVSVAVPKAFEYNSIQDSNGLRIATSYPNTVNDFFNSKNVQVDLHQISGSVEITPNIGLADAIVEIAVLKQEIKKNNIQIRL